MDLVASRQRQRQARRSALAVDRPTQWSSNTVTTSAGILSNRAVKMALRVSSATLLPAMDSSGGITTRSVSGANILDATHAVNATGKRTGLIVYDTTGQRLVVATGSAPTAVWKVADASVTLTPL